MKEGQRMKKYLYVFILAVMVLAACGKGSDDSGQGNGGQVPEILEAKLDVPEKVELNEEITLSVEVVQGEEAVEDADEVKFEIWQEGNQEESEMLPAEHTGKGIYQAAKTFGKDGDYIVQVHVTARDMHTMPKAEVQAGEGGDAGNSADGEAAHEHGEDEGHDHESGGEESSHHHGEAAISFIKPDHIHMKQAAGLDVQVDKKDGAPLEKALVKLEIMKEGKDTPEWVNLTESGEGKYSAEHSFAEAGSYTVTVHVENSEGLHEHSDFPLTVSE
ncbi:FixH family protein [Bacillus infantis]|uniref:FixH family protein n=2 Tax=Bacillaceae TaxID=186817 RepID=A0A5D4SRD4_9BACI|nr:FixH family protein [Bacillus infantis]